MVASLTGSACVRDATEDSRALARPELLDMLGRARVRELGKFYRTNVPSENTAAALHAAISDTERNGVRLPRFGRA